MNTDLHRSTSEDLPGITQTALPWLPKLQNPSVREQAAVDQKQDEVWAAVAGSSGAAAASPVLAGTALFLDGERVYLNDLHLYLLKGTGLGLRRVSGGARRMDLILVH